MKRKGLKYAYTIIIVFMLVVCVIGSTYAYLTSSVSGSDNVATGSTGYDVSMSITPVYYDFTLIPMDDGDAMKAVRNQCKDKYNHGACNAYNIHVYDFNPSIGEISGSINTSLDGITNLSYMVLEETLEDITGNDDCATVDSKNYCIGKGATAVVADTDMSLGDNYSVLGLSSKDLLLVIWVKNLNESQNAFDIGNYNSLVTIYLGGNGGQVSGSIGATLEGYNNLQGGGE